MPITKHTLPNGMTVLLEENHAAPVIAYNVVVPTGSASEAQNEAGICHVIEHMLFKGTPTRPVGAIARDVETSGGEINAYTSYDQTVFYINMASRYAEKGLEILADAVQHPLFDGNELKREQEVILEEIRRERDNPNHVVHERLFEKAYAVHPYRRPIIGFPTTVKSFTRNKLLDFYHRWYAPDKMSLIVVGDFSSEKMLEDIQKVFSEIPPSPPFPPEADQPLAEEKGGSVASPPLKKGGEGGFIEPPQTDLRIHTHAMNIQATYFTLGFHIPQITHKDIPALDVLAHIMAGADSSRLEQVVKEKKRLVHAIYSYAYTPRDPGLFLIGGLMQPENTLKTIGSIWEEVYKIAAEPPHVSELNRAKINIRSSEIYERETVGGEAAKLAYFLATAGDHEFERKYYQALADVQCNDVRRVALEYLSPSNCSVVILDPRGAKSLAGHPEIIAATRKKAGIVKKAPPPVLITRLKNGITLIVREDHRLPIVAVSAGVLGGLRYETPDNNGISALVSKTVTKGTSTKSAVEIAKEIEAIAGSIDGFSGRHTIGLRSEFLSEKLEDGFNLFAEVLTQPVFDETEVEKERDQQIEAIRNQEDNLASMTFVHFMKALYRRHPYGMRSLGAKESVKKLKRGDLRRFWEGLVRPERFVLAVAGDVSPSEIKEFVESRIKFTKTKLRITPPRCALKRPDKPSITEQRRPEKEQAHIVLGFLGTLITSPDHYRLTLLNHILAGQGGRLFMELRDRLSLAYAINSTMQSGLEPGYLAVYIGVAPNKVNDAINGIKRELKRIREELVTLEELERAKQHLVGTYELERQRNMALASSYTINELYGLGVKEIDLYPKKILKITREDVLAAARKYIDLDAYTLAMIKPS